MPVLLAVLIRTLDRSAISFYKMVDFKLPALTDYLIVWQNKVRLGPFVRAVQPRDEPQLKRPLNRNSWVRLDALNIEFSLDELYRRLDELTEAEL